MSAKLERIYWLYQQLKGNRYPSRTGYCRRYEVAASSPAPPDRIVLE